MPPRRSLDRHYWALKANGTPLDSHPMGDAGEFITPGFLTPESIRTYFLMDHETRAKSDPNLWARIQGAATLPEEHIDWILQKVIVGGKPYVLLVSGEKASCALNNRADNRMYLCDNNYGNHRSSGIHSYPIQRSQSLPVRAIVATCEDQTACSVPQGIRALLTNTTSRPVPPDLLKALTGASVPGSTTAVFAANKPDEKIATSKILQISSALLEAQGEGIPKGNVTDRAARHCDGKQECSYSSNPRYLGNPAPNTNKDFEIFWDCMDPAKPGETPPAANRKTIKIPAPADEAQFKVSCPKGLQVKVREATFGGNIKKPQPRDVSAQLRSVCHGLPSCSTTLAAIAGKEGLLPNWSSNLKVQYRCFPAGTEKRQEFATSLSLSCNAP